MNHHRTADFGCRHILNQCLHEVRQLFWSSRLPKFGDEIRKRPLAIVTAMFRRKAYQRFIPDKRLVRVGDQQWRGSVPVCVPIVDVIPPASVSSVLPLGMSRRSDVTAERESGVAGGLRRLGPEKISEKMSICYFSIASTSLHRLPKISV